MRYIDKESISIEQVKCEGCDNHLELYLVGGTEIICDLCLNNIEIDENEALTIQERNS